jgi:BirA family biotin operon repressor/biotin-[acetyl-CoA-carboxylase] ligase
MSRLGGDPAPALPRRLFAALGDGAFHSGAELAAREGVTRSAVWKAVELLREQGAAVEAVPRRGYRLAFPCQPLDAAALRAALALEELPGPLEVECAWSLPSTNSALLARGVPAPGQYRLLVTEHQSAGRGRLGRQWLGALGGSLLLSLSAGIEELPRDIATLPLVAGLSVRRALQRQAPLAVLLKWPNDLVARVAGDGQPRLAKLGGVLTELRAEASGPAHVVIGIGLNLRLPAALRAAIEPAALPPSDLFSLGFTSTDRNLLAAAIARECAAGLVSLRRDGFAARRSEWHEADALGGSAVEVRGAGGPPLGGIARGVDAGGALQLEVDGALRSVLAGDVSLRLPG